MTFTYQINENCPKDGTTLWAGGFCHECKEWFDREERND